MNTKHQYMTPKIHTGHMKQPGNIQNMTKQPEMAIEYTYLSNIVTFKVGIVEVGR